MRSNWAPELPLKFSSLILLYSSKMGIGGLPFAYHKSSSFSTSIFVPFGEREKGEVPEKFHEKQKERGASSLLGIVLSNRLFNVVIHVFHTFVHVNGCDGDIGVGVLIDYEHLMRKSLTHP